MRRNQTFWRQPNLSFEILKETLSALRRGGFIGFGIVVFLGVIFLFSQKVDQPGIFQEALESEQRATVTPRVSEIALPIADFEKRITQKPFGIFIAPANSPVQPERFTGYHTGVDVEFEDVEGKVPVLAICDGEVVLAEWVSGYGGAMGLKCDFENQKLFIFYGHLDPQSLIEKVQVEKGEQIAVLGKGQTRETDFERKHLHFAISKNRLDLQGYVETEEDLGGWYNPQEFYRNLKVL